MLPLPPLNPKSGDAQEIGALSLSVYVPHLRASRRDPRVDVIALLDALTFFGEDLIWVGTHFERVEGLNR